MVRRSEPCLRTARIKGVGPKTATAIVAAIGAPFVAAGALSLLAIAVAARALKPRERGGVREEASRMT